MTNTSSAAAPGAASKKRTAPAGHRRPDPDRGLVLKLLFLVAIVLILFEGRVIGILLTHKTVSSIKVTDSSGSTGSTATASASSDAASGSASADAGSSASASGSGAATASGLAGGSVNLNTQETQAAPAAASSADGTVSESIDSDAVVKEASPPVDDSFFSDAVFIGDSRMEGFRNASGITQGDFLTGVGLSTNDMSKPIISTADGNITVYQGLSGKQYNKIYLMLGANDLGYYSWDEFPAAFDSIIKQFHELQPKACIYICSVIYVDETKIESGYEYDNNDNVRKINSYLLQACEDLWYANYLNLNEVFTNGSGALPTDASADGVHLYPDYLKQMLEYLKSHYISQESWDQTIAEHPDDIANQAPAAVTEQETG